jgi:hypothetical protein
MKRERKIHNWNFGSEVGIRVQMAKVSSDVGGRGDIDRYSGIFMS